MNGCPIATDEVIPAKNKSRNQSVPNTNPNGIFSKIRGIETKPKSKAPADAIWVVKVIPKNAAAAGIAIEPPIPTSANSFRLAVDSPERTISSFGFR